MSGEKDSQSHQATQEEVRLSRLKILCYKYVFFVIIIIAVSILWILLSLFYSSNDEFKFEKCNYFNAKLHDCIYVSCVG